MPFFNRFGRSRRSQPGSNHPLFQDEIKQKESFRGRSVTADYPRAAKPVVSSRVRAASTAHPANKALVTKVISVEKPNPGAVIPDVIPSQVSQASVQVVNAQINAATRKHIQEPTTKSTQEPLDVLKHSLAVGNDRKKRTNSFTNSESEAVGTLDEVLRDFDSMDDNFNEVAQETNGAKTIKTTNGDIFTDETPYATISELKEEEFAKNDAENEIKTIDYPEHIYAKPIKLNSKPTTPTEKSEINVESILNPFDKNEPEEGPEVPPKLFVTEEHDIKFSELRKTPSMPLSQSLKETNAEIPSPNRRPYPVMDSNNNYSLKRGKLSAPNEESTEDYIKPPPDYDVNGTMSSIGKSMSISDDSYTRDNWMGSHSSSSGSRNEPKPIRPEVLDLIRGKKESEQAEGNAKGGPQHDGLVKRSFRLIRQASLKKDLASESPESDYVAIKAEADKWLANKGHLRANLPQAKNYNSTATNSSASGSPQRKVPEPENRSVKLDNVSLKSSSTPFKSNQSRSFKSASKSSKNQVSTDDENLVRLMETGVLPENTSSIVNGSQDPGWSYVPRALRMSYGTNWDGIRKDRRAWKSREINSPPHLNARKGTNKLSSRLDEQSQQLEMLF